MAYGIDANGNPMAANDDLGYGARGQQQCPQGQRFDASQGGCVAQYSDNTQPNPQAAAPAPQQQQQPSAASGFGPQKTNWSQADIAAYGASRGIQNFDPGGYWMQKWNEWGSKDPGYFFSRLQNADEFIGGAQNSPYAGPGVGQGFQIQNYLSGMPQNNFQLAPAPTINPTSYTPTQFSKPAPFNAGPLQGQTQDLIAKLLSSGGSMGPDVVAKMRAGQQDTITAAADAARQNILQSAAMRGTSPGGTTGANLAGVDMTQLGQLSKAYRDIDVNAAQTNFNDQLSAIGASDAFQSQLLDQYLKQAGLNLSTEQSQAGENQFAAQFGAQQEQNKFTNWLQGQGLGLQASMIPFQNWLAAQGLNLNYNQLAEAARQYNMGNSLSVAQFLAS